MVKACEDQSLCVCVCVCVYTDYSAPTPDWAVFGAPEAGFDPEQVCVVCVCVCHRSPLSPLAARFARRLAFD